MAADLSSPDLLAEIIPVFEHYLGQLDRLISTLDDKDMALSNQLVPDTFGALEHFAIAQGFVLRTLYPVLGQPVPDLSPKADAGADLLRRSDAVRALLKSIDLHTDPHSLPPQITHTAGQGDVTQSPKEYVLLFGLPNFFFSLGDGIRKFARCRSAGWQTRF